MSETTYERLAAISAPVAQRYTQVASTLQIELSASEFSQWEHHCVHLAQCGW